MSYMPIVNITLFVNVSNFFKCIIISGMKFSLAHLECFGMIVLCLSMQEKVIIDHTNAKCHVFTIVQSGHILRLNNIMEPTNAKIVVSTLTPRVMRLH